MSLPEIAISISSRGIINIIGNNDEPPLKGTRAVELWHSQPDKGLALRFLDTPTPSSLPLEKPGDDPASARIDAAAFLAKAGFELEESDHWMEVGKYDEERRVLSTRW